MERKIDACLHSLGLQVLNTTAPNVTVVANIPFLASVGSVPSASVTTFAVFVTTKTSMICGIVFIASPPWAMKKSCWNAGVKAKRFPFAVSSPEPELYAESTGPGKIKMAATVAVVK